MPDKILLEGDTIYIKRTNGALQTAIVAAIDYESLCVKVEWFENKETKGKEIHFSNVMSLNSGVSLIKPQAVANHSSYESMEDESLKANSSRKGRDTRVQSARTRLTKSHFDNNFSLLSSNEQLKIEGKAINSARTTRSVIETISKYKENGTLRRASKLEQDRLARRKKQAEAKAEKDEYLRKNRNNPHWELMRMIQVYRRQIEFKPLSNEDSIEDHLITVAVRKRPLNESETSKKEIDIITVPSKNQIIVHEPKHKVDLTKYLENHVFRYDYALNENCSNQIVYRYTAQPLIKTVFNGGFATCFAYGQTGSGKTYTMTGNCENKSEQGIYALTANDIFKHVNSSKYRHHNFIVSCSFFEIYVKKVFDLLNNKAALKILEDGQQQVQIVGLTEKIVSSGKEVLDLIYQGNEERASGQTSANLQSSRSHAIFQFYLRSNANPRVIFGKFSLIDLAGNERGADTFSSSKITRLEGAEINQSLLSLKECIRALGRKGAHLPFRGSKLTQVLRDSFVGTNSKTCMIAMISPGVGSCENTLNTLRYADRVKELGGGDVSIQKLDSSRKESLTSSFGTQSILTPSAVKTIPESNKSKKVGKILRNNKDLIKVLHKYTKRAEALLNIKEADNDTYCVNLNIVVTDAISSLIKIRDLLNYFEVLFSVKLENRTSTIEKCIGMTGMYKYQLASCTPYQNQMMKLENYYLCIY